MTVLRVLSVCVGTGAHRCPARGLGNHWFHVVPKRRIDGAARSNCHMLTLSSLATGRVKAASIPAAARPHCTLHARGFGNAGFVLGLCRWSANFGRF
jgi:hypothetical protein